MGLPFFLSANFFTSFFSYLRLSFKKYAKNVVLYEKDGRFILQTTGLIKREYAELHLVIPMVHGAGIEDGVIQGYLEAIGIPYTSNSLCQSAICQDKVFAKQLLEFNEMFLEISIVFLVLGIGIGVIGSVRSMKKYLKV